ncbi:ras-related gtp-binding protein a-like protein [Malassezia pachydermatis]|uniref:GTP-binding protein n=1 Tax=Malassezia pachydermatis TaxID=77020 RepID=A0A0M8MP10_9BASI|nr:ras-related gtp-binding protein a-like protein [Malassezia pachydermatis]KOS13967.1 ras-related gtp-binding protein a-like protein [Malassezia pachydermatis]
MKRKVRAAQLSTLTQQILLMGKSGTGKTSMRSFIFSSYRSEDTKRLGSTIEVEHSHVRFPGNLVLNLWDCGGQKSYMDSYMNAQRNQVFSAVGALIYVVDVVSTEDENDDTHEWESDLRYFRDCVSALNTHSPDAEVFCLLHKMDLIEPSRRKELYMSRVQDLRKKIREVLKEHASSPNARDSMHLHCYATSIWDATLYKAWSNIVHTIVPEVQRFETHLASLADMCSATEIVLFEKATFLMMSRFSRLQRETQNEDMDNHDTYTVKMQDKNDTEKVLLAGLTGSLVTDSSPATKKGVTLSDDRFERISELVKHFKISCLESQYQVQALELRTSTFMAYMDALTSSTYILVIVSDPRIQMSAVKSNVELCRQQLDRTPPSPQP